MPRFFRECGTIAHAKAAKDGKEDWLLEIGERIAHVPHAWDFKGGPRWAILDAGCLIFSRVRGPDAGRGRDMLMRGCLIFD